MIIRLKILKFIFVSLVAILLIQLFKLQVIEYNRWFQRARERNYVSINYNAVRGDIYFSDGTPLAITKLTYNIYLLPKEIKSKNIKIDHFVDRFSKILNVEQTQIQSAIYSDKLYVLLKKKVNIDSVKQLMDEYPIKYNLWSLEKQYDRVYPNNTVAAKILGFVRFENNKDIGQYGIEQYFNGLLRGYEGILEGLVDKDSMFIANENIDTVKSKNGANITLTIDKSIQYSIENIAKKYTDKFKAKESIIVVMESNTGRILGLSNYPTYNPNFYWEGEVIDCSLEYYNVLNKYCQLEKQKNADIQSNNSNNFDIVLPDDYESNANDNDNKNNNEKIEENLTEEEKEKLSKYTESVREIFRKDKLPINEVFRNSANSVLYEPGSVMKVLTLSIAYETSSISVDPNYNLGSHKGCEKVLDKVLCTYYKIPESNLSVVDMIAKSDNIGALRVALKIPKQKFIDLLEKYGLGKLTNIELADEAIFSVKPYFEWNDVDIATASYGQGIAFTPIQLITAWNVLASDGNYYLPTIIRYIDDNGKRKEIHPKFLYRIISKEALENTLKVSKMATEKSIKNDYVKKVYKQYPFIGKSGTANVIKENEPGYKQGVVNTSYIGFAPIDNPRVTILVWLREPRVGLNNLTPEASNTAAIAWAESLENIMFLLNQPKSSN